MGNLRTNLKVILIGGSSHAGKSTLSETLAATLGWMSLSTDRLAAHPGRPWRRTQGDKVMDTVAEHYLNLSVDELMEDVLRHYRVNVWPQVEELIESYVVDTSANGLVLEGSALWPEFATSLDFDKVGALWLTAAEETFRQRIYANSRYSTKPGRDREMVDKFLQRTIAYDARMVEVVNQRGFMLVDVMQSNVTELAERCLLALGVDGK
ncbi:MAG: AAA family ATPase [Dehalococcoidia bacterium]|nr:AAA family ATPase [Dehalococcoidia bacterium]